MPAREEFDPRRPFDLALRSTRVMGFISTGFGLVLMIVDGFFNRLPQFRLAFKLGGAIIWVLPGVAFVLAGIMMQHRQRWAVVVAMVAAAGQMLMAAAMLVANAFFYGPVSPIPFIMCILWIVALGQMLVHLWKSLSIVANIEGNEPRGFELIRTEPVAAIPMDQSSLSDLGEDESKGTR